MDNRRDMADPEMSAIPQPWDRRPGEPAVWYQRFDVYRMLGPGRTVEEVWRVVTGGDKSARPNGTWRRMFHKWNWQPRAEAFDEFDRPRWRQEQMKKIEESQKRRLNEAMVILVPALKRVHATVPEELTEAEALRRIEYAHRLEMQCLAAPLEVDAQERMDEIEAIAKKALEANK
jgi:hypothetical protein